MIDVRSVIISILMLLVIVAGADSKRRYSPLEIHHLDASDLSSASQWLFLPSPLRHVDVVALPEPIHMTHEFPIVRLGIIKFLNEHMGFHVVAMEGSLVDLWATQDRFLASSRSEGDAADAQLALFPLWNTPEVRRLFQYEAASWATSTPLYIAAYDVQPGSGKGTHGVDAFRLLADRLATYSPRPTTLDLDAWLSHLQPLTNACREFTVTNIPAVTHAIEQLESWIVTVSPAVAARSHHVPLHAAALTLVPTNLRRSLALCSGMVSHSSSNYKVLRDSEGAAFAELLREVSADKKLILWAHWSHLVSDASVAQPSVGGTLRQKLGKRLYTILPIAERGSAIVIFPSRVSDDDIGYGRVWPRSDQFSKRMQELSDGPFFLDLRDPAVNNDQAFAGTQTVWVESRTVQLSLIQTTDAIVWLKDVSPPRLPVPVLLIIGGMHYRAMVGVVLSLSIAVALLAWLTLRASKSQ